MCGRYTLHTSPERLGQVFGAQAPAELRPRYNIAPSQSVLAVRKSAEGREYSLLRWGLVPFWAETEKTGYNMINARAETVAQKPAFRAAYRHRRCLIPADGFYEWKPAESGKQPYHIRMRDSDVFAFAGLWERWEGEDKVLESCTIIVTEANDLMKPIHERMPVILNAEDYETWLDTDRFDAGPLGSLLKPYPADGMQAYPVGKQVNSPKRDDEDCITPLSQQ